MAQPVRGAQVPGSPARHRRFPSVPQSPRVRHMLSNSTRPGSQLERPRIEHACSSKRPQAGRVQTLFVGTRVMVQPVSASQVPGSPARHRRFPSVPQSPLRRHMLSNSTRPVSQLGRPTRAQARSSRRPQATRPISVAGRTSFLACTTQAWFDSMCAMSRTEPSGQVQHQPRSGNSPVLQPTFLMKVARCFLSKMSPGFPQAAPSWTGDHVRTSPDGHCQHSPPLRGSVMSPGSHPSRPCLLAELNLAGKTASQALVELTGKIVRLNPLGHCQHSPALRGS